MGDKKDNTITGTTTTEKDYVNNSSLSFALNDPLPSLELLEKVRQIILYNIELQKLQLHNKHFTNRS